MGGPKVNTSYKKLKNRIGRGRRSNCKGGKRERKRLHNAKKMKNLDKKMLRYYGELANPTKKEESESGPEKTQMSRGRPVKMTGKKLRKIRKRVQSAQREKSQMDVEIQVTKKTKVNRTEDKLDSSENTQGPDEDVEMKDDES